MRDDLHQPSWLSDGIRSVGNWEPLIFRRRSGASGFGSTPEKAFQAEHTEEAVENLVEMGINLVITHFYKGFGIQAEKAEMEMTKRFADLCHEYGLKVGAYVQWHSVMYETFLQEVPDAASWVQVNDEGRPVTLGYAHMPFRHMQCYNREEPVAYLERVIELAVKDAEADLIHLDNFAGAYPEPESCRCAACKQKFIEFLEEKYDVSASEGRERAVSRFGFSTFTHVLPPSYNAHVTPFARDQIQDPITQEWMEFKAECSARQLSHFAAFIRGLNPDVAVECNYGLGPGCNRAFLYAADPPRVLRHADVFWSEEGNEPRLTEAGVLVSRIRTYKRAKSLGSIVLTHTGAGQDTAMGLRKLRIAEAMAYNGQTLGCLGNVRDRVRDFPERKAYLDFFKAHAEYYSDATTVADVAVLTSYPSLAHNSSATHLSALLVEQTLIEGKVPFDIIYDEGLEDLSKYWALVLPNTESLSDEQVDRIMAFVHEGGGLVATEQTSLYDECRRSRGDFALAELFGVSASGRPQSPVMNTFGQGRIVYVPEVVPVKPFAIPRDATRYHTITNDYWHAPRNFHQLVEAVRWACGGSFTVEVLAPLATTVETLKQEAAKRMLLNLVNYDVEREVGTVAVTLSVDAGLARIFAVSPDEEEIQEIEPENSFLVDGFAHYKLVVVEFEE